MSATLSLTRRGFLGGLAAGLGLVVMDGVVHAAAPAATGLQPNVFVHVGADDFVTIVCHRSEMGQGVRSSIPALIADELGAVLSKVKIVQGDGDEIYGDQNTDGSSSIRKRFGEYLQIGATARIMLIDAAAQRWKVPAAECKAYEHAVHHEPTKRSFSFGELADAAGKVPVPKPQQVPLRPRKELRYLGKELPLVDGPDLVTGKAQFAADVKLPDLLIAVIARPPVVGGVVQKLDSKKALAIPGMRKVVELPKATPPFGFHPLGGVAVLADNTWAAMRGVHALEITWDHGKNAHYDSDDYHQQLERSVQQPGKVVRHVGDVPLALKLAPKKLEAVYHTPHLAHAPMEPPCATAHVTKDRCEVWACTQDPQTAKKEIAKQLSIDPKTITIHVTLLGGAFGRKSKPDFIVEAALLAKAAGRPVRVQWTREDDIRHDYYHSTAAQRLVAGIDAQNKVTAWHHRIAFPPIPSTFQNDTFPSTNELQQGVLDQALSIPNVLAEACEAPAHVRIGWMRSVANIYHAFAMQSFFDEIANARGIDPLDNFLELVGPSRKVDVHALGLEKLNNYGQSLDEHPVDAGRLRHVIERAAALSNWRDRKGRALGIAAHRSFLSYIAVVIGVKRDDAGIIRVDEAHIVADCGTIVNLERVRSQLEGAVVFGLSIGLYGAITMKDGATVQSNFRDYRLTRMAEVPRTIDVEVVKSDAPPGGVGEPGVPPVAPALANAIFALTGTRIRTLPIARALPV